MVALNFASDAEAGAFFKTAVATVSNRAKRRRSKKFSPTRTVDNGFNGSIASQKPSGKFNFGGTHFDGKRTFETPSPRSL